MNSEEHSTKNTRFFFDTYALIQIYEAKEDYRKYLDVSFFLTKLNLFEFHQYLLKAKGEAIADLEIQKYHQHILDFDLEIIEKASKFRTASNKRNVSMTDSIGYIFALENGMVFLTGDKEFEGMGNVEFVK